MEQVKTEITEGSVVINMVAKVVQYEMKAMEIEKEFSEKYNNEKFGYGGVLFDRARKFDHMRRGVMELAEALGVKEEVSQQVAIALEELN